MEQTATTFIQNSSAANETLLKWSARSWFTVAVIGQWIFASYVLGFYGQAVIDADLARWNQVMPHGYVEGDLAGNIAVALHLVLALLVLFFGPLQFISSIRARYPAFHRFNGRVYVTTAIVLALGGLYMVWTRGVAGGEIGKYSISLNAFLIIWFAYMAVKNAMARNIKIHQRWALRLFLVMAGVWFFRIGLMLWLMIHQAPVGFDPKTFTGPFLTFLGFAQYLIPLAIAELYFSAKENDSAWLKSSVSAMLILVTLMTAGGVFAATMGMWLPRFS
ncbi:DUF2306 domain-containing protein [Thalassotalea euphylliae]|uniref:DUF2306 domain-containing protein n=1 Tax=Thalassotalea euphylliae TaxID=1655234 RepID=UPI00363B0BDD